MCKSFQGGMDDPRFVQSFVGDGPPAADVVLDFVRVCIANPAPAMLPATLILTAAFLPYATLTPFLSALPAPFTYKFQSRAHARAHAAFLFEKAEEFKLKGNVLYGRRERAAAVEAYAEAADICEHVLLLGHAERDMRGAEKLRAVCLANRAAAHLLDGPGQDVQQALSDGVEAERADSEYVKGYLRQMRAHVLLKNLGEARRVLERAAGKVQGADVQVVAQALDALPQ
ncbi:hypothetical protein FA95DRAFT_1559154 [Auriscalpium vulgare]|uniref:Uncharacterized protein n=1 Tax=Auriscalpium vulgare TaxID=40419 RepID=A0ACB8RTG9_9AGAM|nr:hypothetical protein FA95DRAFT_1559154 [Auriscalpium vulgare]